jgi:hypothetical protein
VIYINVMNVYGGHGDIWTLSRAIVKGKSKLCLADVICVIIVSQLKQLTVNLNPENC